MYSILEKLLEKRIVLRGEYSYTAAIRGIYVEQIVLAGDFGRVIMQSTAATTTLDG